MFARATLLTGLLVLLSLPTAGAQSSGGMLRAIVQLEGQRDLTEMSNARRAGATRGQLHAIAEELRSRLDLERAPVLRRIEASGGRINRSFWIVNAVSATIPAGRLAELQDDPAVRAIWPDVLAPPAFNPVPGSPGPLQTLDFLGVSAPSTDGLGDTFTEAWGAAPNTLGARAGQGVIIAIADSGFDLYAGSSHAGAPEFLLPVQPLSLQPNPIYADSEDDWGDQAVFPGTRILDARDMCTTDGDPSAVPGACPFDPLHVPPEEFVETAEDINTDFGSNLFFGHGTAVSNAAAGHSTGNSTGPSGCPPLPFGPAYRSGLLLYKISDDTTPGSYSWATTRIAAIEAACADGADVFNMSYGGIPAPTGPEAVAFDQAALMDLLIFVPAGNDTGRYAYPVEHAHFNSVIVGSVDGPVLNPMAPYTIPPTSLSGIEYVKYDGTVTPGYVHPAHFEECGPSTTLGGISGYIDPNNPALGLMLEPSGRNGVNVVAPGEGISLVAVDLDNGAHAFPDPNCSQLVKVSGTSLSSPFAAGIGAIVRGVAPQLTALEVKTLIMASADFCGPLGNKSSNMCPTGTHIPIAKAGTGLVQANAAVAGALGEWVGSGTLTEDADIETEYVEAWLRYVFPPGHPGGTRIVASWNRMDLGDKDADDLKLEVWADFGSGPGVDRMSDLAKENFEFIGAVWQPPGTQGPGGAYTRVRIGKSGSDPLKDANGVDVAIATRHVDLPFRLAAPFEISTVAPGAIPANGGSPVQILGPFGEPFTYLVTSVTFDGQPALAPGPSVMSEPNAGSWVEAVPPRMNPQGGVDVEISIINSDLETVTSAFNVDALPRAQFDQAVYRKGDSGTLSFEWAAPGQDLMFVVFWAHSDQFPLPSCSPPSLCDAGSGYYGQFIAPINPNWLVIFPNKPASLSFQIDPNSQISGLPIYMSLQAVEQIKELDGTPFYYVSDPATFELRGPRPILP